MNVMGRQDRPLLAGLVVALLVVFSGQVRELLDLARDVEQHSGVALLLPLIILTVVFLFHLQGKRQEARGQAAAADAERREAETRANELEGLVAFGQALARSLDVTAIRDVVLQHVEGLTGTKQTWVVLAGRDAWQVLVDPRRPGAGLGTRFDMPPRLLEVATGDAWRDGQAIAAGGISWWPMGAGGELVGFLGLSEAGARTGSQERVVITAATLLGISLQTARLFEHERESALKDGLTGCFNRTHALERIEVELRRARRTGMPLSLIMFDIDGFKAFNDEHGHLCGDAVLAAVGQRMGELLRVSDLKCRYGGEEFLVLLPDTPVEGAYQVADMLRREIAQRPIAWSADVVNITASFGVAASDAVETDVSAFIGRADSALYHAKQLGRNRVCLTHEHAA